jgi:hypothetical protein
MVDAPPASFSAGDSLELVPRHPWPRIAIPRRGRKPAQLVVDEGQQLLGGLRFALLDSGQDAGDVAHGC